MRFGVAASLLLHLCAIGLLFVSLPEGWRPKVTPEPYVPIEIISQAELAEKTSVPAAAPKPKPEVKPEPEPPAPEKVEAPAPEPVEEKKPETETPPPPPQEQAAPKPEPEPVAPEPEKKPEPPKPKPKPKPKKDTGELDLDRLSALVNKERAKEQPQQGAPSETPIESERTQRQVGAGDRLAASEKAKMQAAIYRCWQIGAIAGMPEANRLIVTVEFELNRDGTLDGQPRVANEMQINLSGNKFWKVAEQSAVRAVVSCQPYDFFPQDKYSDWREWRLDFDPSQAAGY
jgi:outer membrane biosynthesis protein TonB